MGLNKKKNLYFKLYIVGLIILFIFNVYLFFSDHTRLVGVNYIASILLAFDLGMYLEDFLYGR